MLYMWEWIMLFNDHNASLPCINSNKQRSFSHFPNSEINFDQIKDKS